MGLPGAKRASTRRDDSEARGTGLVLRHEDGSADDANYGVIGSDYSRYRRPDPRIAARITRALGDAQTLLNVGAGAGSYEPIDRVVTAVEPSASMRAQRPDHLPVAIDAVAEHLPFEDGRFDASMASFTVHQWGIWKRACARCGGSRAGRS
jgi:hypothetical protein